MHKDRLYCIECDEDVQYEMHIPKKISCPICGNRMSSLRRISQMDSSGEESFQTSNERSMKINNMKVQTFMCDRCLNLQYFLDETKME